MVEIKRNGGNEKNQIPSCLGLSQSPVTSVAMAGETCLLVLGVSMDSTRCPSPALFGLWTHKIGTSFFAQLSYHPHESHYEVILKSSNCFSFWGDLHLERDFQDYVLLQKSRKD